MKKEEKLNAVFHQKVEEISEDAIESVQKILDRKDYSATDKFFALKGTMSGLSENIPWHLVKDQLHFHTT